MWSLKLLSSWKAYIVYVQFKGSVYQQNSEGSYGTNCVPLIVHLLLFCYERDFMSKLHKSKQYGLIDKFNDTFRYLISPGWVVMSLESNRTVFTCPSWLDLLDVVLA